MVNINAAAAATDKRRRRQHSLKVYVLHACLLFLIYTLVSVLIVLHYRHHLLDSNDYWLKQINRSRMLLVANRSSSSLCNQSAQSPNEQTVSALLDALNADARFNYFLCFSSLYMAVKIENRPLLTITEQQQLQHNSSNCRQTKSPVQSTTTVHLCFLKRHNLTNVCDLVARQSFRISQPTTVISCHYNWLNGEYAVKVAASSLPNDTRITLLFHQYQRDYEYLRHTLNAFLAYVTSLTAATTTKEEKDNNSTLLSTQQHINDEYSIDTSVQMHVGLLGYLYGTEVFDLPIEMFYTPTTTSKDVAASASSTSSSIEYSMSTHFVEYVSAKMRVPTDVVSYFMMFYRNIWYLGVNRTMML